MGGDLEFAVLARVRTKTEFMATRIFKACKGFGTDEETIARVLGCMSKIEAEQIEAHYNAFYNDESAPFNNFSELLRCLFFLFLKKRGGILVYSPSLPRNFLY